MDNEEKILEMLAAMQSDIKEIKKTVEIQDDRLDYIDIQLDGLEKAVNGVRRSMSSCDEQFSKLDSQLFELRWKVGPLDTMRKLADIDTQSIIRRISDLSEAIKELSELSRKEGRSLS